MYSNRRPAKRTPAQEKGKTTRPELCAQDRSEAAKAVWAKASHCRANLCEKAGSGRGNHISRVQVRRTAVQLPLCGKKDECVGRALPVAFGTDTPFFVRKRRIFVHRTFLHPSSINLRCKEGITRIPMKSYVPTGNATRAQVAAILHRFVENVAKTTN